MVIEAIVLYLVSSLIGWNYVDTIFIGSILFFGISWLFSLYSHQINNEFNAYEKAWTGKEAGTILPFIFKMNSIIVGQILFIILALLITVIYYLPYFL